MTPAARVLPFRGEASEVGAVVTVIGPPKSGKTSHLWRRYARNPARPLPRILSLDVVGEASERDRDAREVFGLEALLAEFRDVAGVGTWHIAASLEPDELEELFWILCPHRRSATTQGFGKAVGGLAIFCDELRGVAPNGLKSSRVKTAYLQYRHHWLTLLGATQHAADVDACTRVGDRLVALRSVDDTTVAAIARATSRAIGERVAELEEYHSITCIRAEGAAYIADADDRVYEVIDYRGRVLRAAPGVRSGGNVTASRA